MAFFSNTQPVILHVGFAHTGTTSLQENIFSCRSDLLYCGIPYHANLDNIFSSIKYSTEREFDIGQINALCDKHIWSRVKPNQTVIVSDESLTEQNEVYYTTHLMPTSVIAARLKMLFPKAKILFTIRNQSSYTTSSYLNLKRNYAQLAQRPMEDFNAWFAGNHTQMKNLYLRNIDYSQPIMDYIDVFGQEAISVIPLELLQRQGTKSYLDQLAKAIGITISPDDIARFSVVRNKRMTILEDYVMTQCVNKNWRGVYEILVAILKNNYLSNAINMPVQINLSNSQKETLQQRVAQGNQFIAEKFGIPLNDYGYMMPKPNVIKRFITAFTSLRAGKEEETTLKIP